MEKFADFADEQPLDGDKIKIDEIINKEITVTGYNINSSKYKTNNSTKCLKLQININNKHYVLFTGSSVLLDQIEKYKSHIPFIATITKIDKFYSFS